MRRLAHRPAGIVVGLASAATLVATTAAVPAAGAGVGGTDAVHAAAAGHAERQPVGKRGSWKVAASSPGGYRLTWTSPTRLPYSDARPEIVVDGRWAGPTTLSPN